MEWLLLLVLAAGGGGVAVRRWRQRSERRADDREELDGVRRLADEDVTVLGEQLQRLDAEVRDQDLDEPTRVDYQTALEAYESAQRAVPRIRRADEVSKITDTLSTGRFALACVRARVAGQPVPEQRVPCFFNPQHGPSVTHVLWTHPGRGTRRVPACAQDAARVANHEQPEVRRVRLGARTVPYWEAGNAYLPYTEGYFAGSVLLTWAYTAAADPGGFEGGLAGDYGAGLDVGGFDGGGGGGDG